MRDVRVLHAACRCLLWHLLLLLLLLSSSSWRFLPSSLSSELLCS